MTDRHENGSDEPQEFKDISSIFYPEADPEPEVPTDEAIEEVPETDDEEVTETVDTDPVEEPESDDEPEATDSNNDFATRYSYDEDSGRYEFKSNGEKVTASTQDLIDNYRGGLKVDTELQNIARERKGIFNDAKKSELEELNKTKQEYVSKAAQLDKALKEYEQTIDWQELEETDPGEYAAKKLKLEEHRKQMAGAQQEVLRQNEEWVREQANTLIKEMGEEWQDVEARQKGFTAARHALLDEGFTEQELEDTGFSDKRLWKLAIKVSKYNALKKNPIKETKPVPKATRSKRKPAEADKPRTAAEIMYGS